MRPVLGPVGCRCWDKRQKRAAQIDFGVFLDPPSKEDTSTTKTTALPTTIPEMNITPLSESPNPTKSNDSEHDAGTSQMRCLEDEIEQGNLCVKSNKPNRNGMDTPTGDSQQSLFDYYYDY